MVFWFMKDWCNGPEIQRNYDLLVIMMNRSSLKVYLWPPYIEQTTFIWSSFQAFVSLWQNLAHKVCNEKRHGPLGSRKCLTMSPQWLKEEYFVWLNKNYLPFLYVKHIHKAHLQQSKLQSYTKNPDMNTHSKWNRR